jgi:hypothetical protein
MFLLMDEPELDEATAESLLDGRLAPDDAPQGFQDVARALHAAALIASERPTEDASTAVAAFLAATPTRRTARMKKWKIAAAALAGATLSMGGLAAADVLPGPAQNAASSALSHVGINVPGGDDDSTDVSTKKAAKTEQTDDELTPTTTHPENHGSVVSNVAHDESNVGADHGAAVCATASEDKCKAGEEHPSGAASTQSNNGSGSANSGSSNSSTNGETNSGGASTNGSSNSSSTNSGSSSSSGGSSSSGSSSSSGGSSSSSGSTTGG